jgi:hypothetical protein
VYELCEKILHLTFACVAAADAHALSGWGGVDIEARLRSKPGHWIGIGEIEPMRAAIVREAERPGIGDAAAAELICCFENGDAPAGGDEPACRRNAGRSCTNDDGIHITGARHLGRGARRRYRRPAGERRGTDK